MAVAAKYQKGLLYKTFTERVLTAEWKDIAAAHRKAIRTYYDRRKGHVIDNVNDNIARIGSYAGGTQLAIDYRIDLRFLDIPKEIDGSRKAIYGPVYNKILWGHFYRSIVPTLRYGLNASIEQEIIEELRQSYNQINE